MKKLGFLLVMMVGLLSITNSVNAQWNRVGTAAGDTIATVGTLDTVFKVVQLTAGYSAWNIKVEYTKNSGTVALKAYLYPGDGTDFDAVTDSSAAFSNASGFVYFPKTTVPTYSHYRVQIRASNGAVSTQNVSIVVKYRAVGFDGKRL